MIKLPLCPVAVGVLWLAAGPAGAADGCLEPLPEIQEMMHRAVVDELTREMVDTLLEDAVELCEEGAREDAEIKFANALELLTSEVDQEERQ
jgi:hypothetical protein